MKDRHTLDFNSNFYLLPGNEPHRKKFPRLVEFSLSYDTHLFSCAAGYRVPLEPYVGRFTGFFVEATLGLAFSSSDFMIVKRTKFLSKEKFEIAERATERARGPRVVVQLNGLQAEEAEAIKETLTRKGFVFVDNPRKADGVIRLDFYGLYSKLMIIDSLAFSQTERWSLVWKSAKTGEILFREGGWYKVPEFSSGRTYTSALMNLSPLTTSE